MPGIRPAFVLTGLGTAVLLALAPGSAAQGQAEIRWRPVKVFPGIVDVVGPRADGRLVVAAKAGLFLHRRGGRATPFARGPDGYVPAAGEPYIALARDRRLPAAGCSFRRDDLYALVPTATPGIARIDRRGRAQRFADLPVGAFPSGITFDTVGRFGHRLLVTALFGQSLTVYALDCRGRSSVVLEGGPRVEGGIAVAPRTFGRFAGQLIAPGRARRPAVRRSTAAAGRRECSRVSAFPTAATSASSRSGSSRRASIAGASPTSPISLAPGAPTEGTDSLLTARGRELVRAGVRPGDLLVASEGRAITFSIRCRQRCTVRRIGRSDRRLARGGSSDLRRRAAAAR